VSILEFLLLVFTFNVMTFGNGPVMIPLLQESLVEERGVLTQDQLLYAFTIARVTPGQANVYVASIGYMLFGLPGALLATAVILVPGYLMLGAMGLYGRLSAAAPVRGFTRGLTAASVGLIFAAVINIARSSLGNWIAWVVFATTLVLAQLLKMNPIVSLVVAVVLGLGLHLLAGQ
jgi:chromate transporter